MWSLHILPVCVGFLWAFRFPPTPLWCAHQVNQHVCLVPVWVGVGVSGSVMGVLYWMGPTLYPELLG